MCLLQNASINYRAFEIHFQEELYLAADVNKHVRHDVIQFMFGISDIKI